ncbi:MAG: CBS domain-containing protein [Candidatus Saccharimonadales bacterium]
MHTFLSVLFGLLTLLTVSLQRTYSRVPLKELKRRSRDGDVLAGAIMKAVGYDYTLRSVLWFLIGASAAGFFVIVSISAPVWFALAASVLLVWLGFVWIPAARVTRASEYIAAWSAPALAKLLSYVHPTANIVERFIRKHRPIRIHTGLYDRGDLIDLLEQQQVQPDNHIERVELEIALHALKFGDDTVSQHMVPRRVVKAVSVDEAIGPIFMDELHSSGHSRFPVYDGDNSNIVGVLYLRDIINVKHGGLVGKHMNKGVSYVHEDQSLHDALQAILKTRRQLFVAVNSFEEYVGIITMEDVLEAIIGRPIIDEFDQYDDLRAVAARSAKVDHKQRKPNEAPVASGELEPVKKSAIPEDSIDETVEL